MTLVLFNLCFDQNRSTADVCTNISAKIPHQYLRHELKCFFSPRCSRKRCFLRLPAYLGGYGMSNTISEPFSGERTQTGKGIGTGNRNQTQINFVSPSALSIFPVHPARCEGTIGNMKTHFRVSWIEFTLQYMSSHFQFSIFIFDKRHTSRYKYFLVLTCRQALICR